MNLVKETLKKTTTEDPNPDNAAISHGFHVSFCLMKNDRRWESCQAHVTPKTTSWTKVHLTTRAFVVSL